MCQIFRYWKIFTIFGKIVRVEKNITTMTGLHLDFLLAAGAVLLAAAVSAFVYVKNENNSMDELFEANVEALTQSESQDGYARVIKLESSHTLICNGIGRLVCEW